jgi:hypothetical protein
MSDWVLVPCLVALRTEFNTVAPRRDKGADGSIGDSNHNSSSDHSPDEDSAVLRDHDADSKNEVHALDIDSSGPWPGGPAWFDRAIKAIVERHRTGQDNRLQYVIWNRQIANRAIDNWRWRTYTSTTDPHTNHAHMSARYTTAQENDTSSWGVADGNEDDMAAAEDLIEITESTAKRIGKKTGEKVSLATLVQLGVIYSKDAESGQGAIQAKLDAQAVRLAALEAAVGQVDEQTAARIFEGSNDELVAVLLAALGRTRTQDLARLILSTQG